MRRDLGRLEAIEFDVVVIGGGIFGACIAWDASLRGLRVALVEQDDFGHATSANSFKMVHGGIRYLQHGDVRRIRESSRERNALLKIAPHLVEPLPILIPTYGRGLKGKEVLWVGMRAYDLLTVDRNRGLEDPDRRIAPCRLIGRDAALELVPGLSRDGLTGAGLFHDAQMYNPTRLVLAFLKGAAENGAAVANYVRAETFVERDGRITGVRVRDMIGEGAFTVRGKYVVNAAGPWAAGLLQDRFEGPNPTFSRDACFVIPRRLTGSCALAVLGATHDPDALLSRNARHLFLVPWRDVTLVGVWHVVHEGPPNRFEVTRREVEAFVSEVNRAYPAAGLTVDEVGIANAGLVLFGDRQTSKEHLSYGKRSLIIDHEVQHDLPGLFTVIGVRYTVARAVGERVADMILRRLGRPWTKSRTRATLLPGGRVRTVSAFLSEARDRHGASVGRAIERLVRNYGSELDRVLAQDPPLHTLAGSVYLRAEVLHGIRDEMALTLGDVVFRRMDLATAARPSSDVLEAAAAVMGVELGWSSTRIEGEVEQVMTRFDFPARPLGEKPAPRAEAVP